MPKLRIDWKAYFKRFCEEHGPSVGYKRTMLLFQDGYQYSAESYVGPEVKPPENPDELRELLITYWTRRLEIQSRELVIMRRRLDRLEETQSTRSVPLQRSLSLRERTEAAKEGVEPDTELDLDWLRGRVSWLEADAAECRGRVKELRRSVGGDGGPTPEREH